ncbi:tetratricopeptide repeat protein [Actinomadura graeca]|uniref:Tetratricopeptide repeat protein n=1 Tax=Actinomadura graeca TaxID=2750812 RepID=A0ABX8R3T7_9ACTN|nr:FxSxx-COOH system tetratricopeptide repeat protein [Actinomadura graeca]QXJ25731.1 tetratricopeptide repeat protein [Actinomadura graeca]
MMRWLIATGAGIVSVGVVWIWCDLWVGLDVQTSATVAALVLPIVGAPLAAWAGHAASNGSASESSSREERPELMPAWNLPPRSRIFVGRSGQLKMLKGGRRKRGQAVVQVLYGAGGIGKTSLVVEYAYRFADRYSIVWWIDAEQAESIPGQIAALGVAAGWVMPNADIPSAAQQTIRRLRVISGWLIIFDNAETPLTVNRWLPQGSGHTLVTSRSPNWEMVGTSVPLSVFSRTESVELIKRLVSVSEDEADRVANILGDLPLAITQASFVMSETGMSAAEYLSELTTDGRELLSDGQPPNYHASLAQVVTSSLGRLDAEDRAAVQVLEICSMLAAEPIPIDIFACGTDGTFCEPLSQTVRSTLALRRSLGRIARYGLARVDQSNIQLHRLVQLIIAEKIDRTSLRRVRKCADRALASACPDDSRDTASWERWEHLLPHLLATDLAGTSSPALRSAACRFVWYQLERGELERGEELARSLHYQWRVTLGPDDPQNLDAAHALVSAFIRQRRYAEIQSLVTEVFERRCNVLGIDHQDTLNSADHLASIMRELGELEVARALHEETLTRKKQVLGENHRDTMGTAHNLALDLRRLGLFEDALTLNEETLSGRREALGDNHPHTLLSAHDVAVDLRALGHLDQALALCQDTVVRRKLLLGEEHHATLDSVRLAADLWNQVRRGGNRR